MNAEVFRQRARDCRMLASECNDFYAREALIELAVEFERMAEDLDAHARCGWNERARRQNQVRENVPLHRQPPPR